MADAPRTQPVDEMLLVRRFARGDQAAFDRIVHLHQGRVAALARRLLGWPDDVDDVVQEVFVAALGGLKRFRGEAALATWLAAITVNACRKHRRRRLLWLRFLGGAATQSRATSTESPEPAAARNERSDRVRHAVRRLPAKYREVVVLYYLEQMPVADLCRVLGISRSAAEARLYRARVRLKDSLAGILEE